MKKVLDLHVFPTKRVIALHVLLIKGLKEEGRSNTLKDIFTYPPSSGYVKVKDFFLRMH